MKHILLLSLLISTPAFALKFKYRSEVIVPISKDQFSFYGETVGEIISFEKDKVCKSSGYSYQVQFKLGNVWYNKDYCEEGLEAK